MHWSRLSASASGVLVSWASSRTWTLKPTVPADDIRDRRRGSQPAPP
jgi:hypothetical protein